MKCHGYFIVNFIISTQYMFKQYLFLQQLMVFLALGLLGQAIRHHQCQVVGQSVDVGRGSKSRIVRVRVG